MGAAKSEARTGHAGAFAAVPAPDYPGGTRRARISPRAVSTQRLFSGERLLAPRVE